MLLISLTRENIQKNLLDYFFTQCKYYTVIYPDSSDAEDENENPLLTKKSDFLMLKEITISPWAEMTNSIAISGPLTQQAKAIFYSSLKAKGLWQYKLYSDCMDILFEVNDFDIGVINISDSACDKLIKEDIISLNDFF